MDEKERGCWNREEISYKLGGVIGGKGAVEVGDHCAGWREPVDHIIDPHASAIEKSYQAQIPVEPAVGEKGEGDAVGRRELQIHVSHEKDQANHLAQSKAGETARQVIQVPKPHCGPHAEGT